MLKRLQLLKIEALLQLRPSYKEAMLNILLTCLIARVKEVVGDVFAYPDGELGHTTLVQHTIDTGDNHPIKQPPRRLPVAQREIADKEVEKMLLKGFIEPCDSPWVSPIVLVAKKECQYEVLHRIPPA